MKTETLIDIAIFFVIIVFLQFFSLTLLENKAIQWQMVLLTGFLLVAVSVYGILFTKGVKFFAFDKLVLFYILSMIVSSIMAKVYWNQSFSSSLKAYSFFYIHFLYIILVVFNVSKERTERLLVILFFISLAVFLIDYITFPNPLFSWRNEERRNGITIFFYGQGFCFLGAFYFLSKFFEEKKIKQLILFLISFCCLFFLTQSRLILIGLVLGFFLILLSSEYKKKYLIGLIVLVSGTILYTTASVFNGIKDASKDEAQYYKENIRLQAQNYYLTELQGGTPTMIFGNGIPAVNSKLGTETDTANTLGYWAADIGLTGIYSYFGVVGVIGLLIIFFSVLKLKNSKDSAYLKAYCLVLLTTAFTGFSLFDPGYMPATILVLYLTRIEIISNKEKILIAKSEANYAFGLNKT